MWSIKDAAEYVKTTKAPLAFLLFIKAITKVFTFTQERKNRLVRFTKIIKAYKAGQPVRDIEAEFGCSRSTIQRYVRLAGCPKRPKSFENSVREEVIVAYKAKVPVAEIAKKHKVSQAYVSKVATEEGINRYKGRRN